MPGALITAQELRTILRRVAQRIAEQESYLNSLDAAIGDGDHGITMRLGIQAIIGKLSELDSQAGVDVICREAGVAFMNASGGAIGVIGATPAGRGVGTVAGVILVRSRYGLLEVPV